MKTEDGRPDRSARGGRAAFASALLPAAARWASGAMLGLAARGRNTTRRTPYGGAGGWFFDASFDADARWKLRYPDEATWVALGRPAPCRNERRRTIQTGDGDGSFWYVGGIIRLAHAVGCRVIAEGVETEAQRDALAAQGCAAYQGYLFSAPRPLAELEAFLDAWPQRAP